MRIKLAIAAALALGAAAVPSAVQAQGYYGYSGYDHGHARYSGHDWRERQRWEREHAREERRAHRRWEREHRHHDTHWDHYR